MVQERRKVKKVTKKGKTLITQNVTVNIGKGRRGRKTSSGPPQPSQAERILHLFTPLLKQQPIIQANQPIQPSTFNQQSLEAVLQRLIPRQGPQGPQGLQGPQGPPGPIFNFDMDASMRSSDSRASLDSFAFDFSDLGQLGQSYVLDQPDAPLVGPAQPAFAGGPQRLDPAHEDVPLRQLGVDEEGVGEGKQEEQQQEEQQQEEQQQEPIPYLSPNEVPPIKFITKEFLDNAPNTSTQKTRKVTTRMIANSYDIPLSSKMLKSSKEAITTYLWSEIQKKK
jgi:hypothetical protein